MRSSGLHTQCKRMVAHSAKNTLQPSYTVGIPLIDEKIGKLGFGLMRLPKKGDAIDVEQTKEMVDLFMEAGFNYFDTAWAYPGSEEATRQALVERYPRDSYFIATKNAAWRVSKSKEDALGMFDESLRRLGVDYVDFYLLHNLGNNRIEVFERFGLWDYVKDLKAQGKVRHIGFSFHDKAEVLERLLQEHPEMDFVQLQINYNDWESNDIQSRKCYEVARKYGKPIVVMEPVKGGLLANPPDKVEKVFKEAEPDSSCASWAIRFCAEKEGILTVLSGMSSVEQMKDNLSYMKGFTTLTQDQRDTIKKATDVLATYPIIPCTTCNYCAEVCPKDIGISGTFMASNQVIQFGLTEFSKSQLDWLVNWQGRKMASECIKCGKCEDVCPQKIKIRDELERCTALFEGKTV